MANLESKIRKIINEKKVALAENADLGGAGVNPPGAVTPTWDDLGSAPDSPHGALPDYGKGVKARQASLPKMNAIPGVGTVDGDGIPYTPNSVREEDEKKDVDKKDEKKDHPKDCDCAACGKKEVKEDAKSENDRQYEKIKNGEKQQHVKGQDANPDKDYDKGGAVKPVNEADDDDDDQDDDDKKDMAEDVNALFAGEKLTEAFKKKAATIYEAAVSSRVKTIVERRTTKLQDQFYIEIAEIQESLTKKVDSYLNYVVEEWLTENTIAIEKGIKSDLTEGFILGLKDLFQEHYIEVPQDKVDVLEALSDKIEELEEQLNQQISNNVGLKESNSQFERDNYLNESLIGLSTSQADKLKQLAEGLDFKSPEAFKESLSTLRESALVKPQSSKQNLTEDATGPLNTENKTTSASVKPVLDALRKASPKN